MLYVFLLFQLMSMKDELSQAKKESTDLRNDLEDSKNTIKKNEALTSELRRKLEETENEIKEQASIKEVNNKQVS